MELIAGSGCSFQLVLEASGVDEAADGVVGEVSESQGDAAQVLEASVDRLAWGRWRSRDDRSGPGCRRSARSGSGPAR